ncbi:MAG: hypothetical protein JF606_25010 [Burkholderiales bacterium]|nr:hypothetical protein [Burkholderiales bacterium]
MATQIPRSKRLGLGAKRLEVGSFIRNWSDMRSGEIDCTAPDQIARRPIRHHDA